MSQNTGKYIIIAGLVLVIFGAAVYLLGDKLNWLGKLPGDIRVEKDNFKFFFPITTMIIVSVVINLIIVIIRKILG
ncbi:DUF2905 domain-containing protein [Dyadobacter sp. CY345]|uniref:DUF2905 domain-containing protein n=1 Tax=Dyadobacter sp. CY345 TaxID=2909335 RepID=UPI001F45847B|nr:DUF2905 domain-containing protein [Dyadobacter sp. CY345]MCF2446840.1 DUF2905 domain-containing protein [Dyadobacter sp. CY345]